MPCDFARIVIDEVADPVMRDAPELGPFAQRADGRLLVFGKDSAEAQADDVRELSFDAGNCGCFHASSFGSTQAAGFARAAPAGAS